MFQPSDSQHIERLLKPEVYVEKWFTLEEHAVAQTRCILIGQETSRQRLAKSKQRAFELNRELERQEVGVSCRQLILLTESRF